MEYENKNKIPPGWVNYAISRNAPNGWWHRLERGEIKMDATFFEGFNADLRNEQFWKDYRTSYQSKKALKDFANSTQLGDHVSLKAERADSQPTNQDRGAQSFPASMKNTQDQHGSSKGRPSLSKLAKDSTIGDLVSLEAEDVVQSGQRSDTSSDRSSISSLPEPSTVHDSVAPIPSVDAEALLWSMMAHSRNPDPYMFPALLRLQSIPVEKRPLIAALSNTVTFPPGHPYNTLSNPSESDPRSHFDIFIASADVGLLKPDPKIYNLAVEKLDKLDKERGGIGIRSEDCVFLDDIGENLKPAKQMGMRTIKVVLGKTWRAVKELEQHTKTDLMDEKTRRSKL